jgi:hypothetical protein
MQGLEGKISAAELAGADALWNESIIARLRLKVTVLSSCWGGVEKEDTQLMFVLLASNRPTIVTDSTPMLFPPEPCIIRRAGTLGPYCWTSLLNAHFLGWCGLSGVAGSVMSCRSWIGRSLEVLEILEEYDFLLKNPFPKHAPRHAENNAMNKPQRISRIILITCRMQAYGATAWARLRP